MTTLIMVRHGETLWHEDNRYAGHSDVALTPLGFAQGEALGAWAKTAQLDAIYTSDLSRAIHTAAPSEQASGLAAVRDARLREVNFGDGEGLTRAEMGQQFPELLAEWLEAPASRALPGGETGLEAAERALAALADIVAAHPEGRVLVVGHSTVTRLVATRLLGMDADTYRKRLPQLKNAHLNEFRLDAATFTAQHPAGALHSYNQPPTGPAPDAHH